MMAPMVVVLLATVLFGQAPPPEPEIPTARALAEACRIWVDTKAERSAAGRNGAALTMSGNRCQREALMMMTSMQEKMEGMAGSGFCPPEPFWSAFDPAATMAEAYLAYLDSRPALQNEADGLTVFRAAMVQNWPCPR